MKMKLPDLKFLARDESGIAAVEFAIGAPILIFSLIAMVDTGLAIGDRMELDRTVRAGAQAAMSLQNDAAEIQGFIEAATIDLTPVTVNVAKSCTCGTNVATCNTICSGGDAPSVFIEINAVESYDGLLLNSIQLESSTRVQLR
jgi:Flp pilus assembly protein TadG